MPVLAKIRLKMLQDELNNRFSNLWSQLEGRDLLRNTEGCKRGHWINPDTMSATKGSDIEIRMAVEDFKNILAEIKKLK